MTDPKIQALQQALLAGRDHVLANWQRLLALGLHDQGHSRGRPSPIEQEAEMNAMLGDLIAALGDGGASLLQDRQHPLAKSLRGASELRASRGYSPEETLQYLQSCRDALQLQASAAAQNMADLQTVTQALSRLLDRCVLVLASGFIKAREAIMASQSESLREVSTPVITLWDSMLLLPLVGIVDSVRAQVISERLLQAISDTEAEVTLIDVTGVPLMDTSVARHILKTVTAAEMLGTRVVLTGISPSTAQTMVKLGIDMSGVPTRASLKSGLALAMTLTRRRVVPLDDGAGAAA